MSRRGLVIAFGLGLAVVLGGWAVARSTAADEASWAEVTRGDLVAGFAVTGTLEAVDSVMIGPPSIPEFWDFKLSYLVAEGTSVQAGDKVAAFDTSELERRLGELEAELALAEEELKKHRSDLSKRLEGKKLQLVEAEAKARKLEYKVDVPKELVASSELTETHLDLALAQQEIRHFTESLGYDRLQGKAKEQALSETRNRAAGRVREVGEKIDKMTVMAPRAGTAVYVSGRGRQTKKVGDSVWRRESILEIPDLTQMRARGEVEEADFGRLATGQPIRFRLDAHPDLEFRGQVEEIGNALRSRSRRDRTKVVEVVMLLESTDTLRMRPGMRFRGSIETERADQVLWVPVEALQLTRGTPEVEVQRRFGWEVVQPTLGLQSGSRVQIVAGLSLGDKVKLVSGAATP